MSLFQHGSPKVPRQLLISAGCHADRLANREVAAMVEQGPRSPTSHRRALPAGQLIE